MSKITNDDLTWSGTGCFIAVPIWQQWASHRRVNKQIYRYSAWCWRQSSARYRCVPSDRHCLQLLTEAVWLSQSVLPAASPSTILSCSRSARNCLSAEQPSQHSHYYYQYSTSTNATITDDFVNTEQRKPTQSYSGQRITNLSKLICTAYHHRTHNAMNVPVLRKQLKLMTDYADCPEEKFQRQKNSIDQCQLSLLATMSLLH